MVAIFIESKEREGRLENQVQGMLECADGYKALKAKGDGHLMDSKASPFKPSPVRPIPGEYLGNIWGYLGSLPLRSIWRNSGPFIYNQGCSCPIGTRLPEPLPALGHTKKYRVSGITIVVGFPGV